jgi:hypothetical protein
VTLIRDDRPDDPPSEAQTRISAATLRDRPRPSKKNLIFQNNAAKIEATFEIELQPILHADLIMPRTELTLPAFAGAESPDEAQSFVGFHCLADLKPISIFVDAEIELFCGPGQSQFGLRGFVDDKAAQHFSLMKEETSECVQERAGARLEKAEIHCRQP